MGLIRTLNRLSRRQFIKILQSNNEPERLSFCLHENGLAVRQKVVDRLQKDVSTINQFSEVVNMKDFRHFVQKDDFNSMFSVVLKNENSVSNFEVKLTDDEKFEVIEQNINQMSTLTFFKETNWKFVYQDLMRKRRKLWKDYLINPWSIAMEQKNPFSDNPQTTLTCNFEDQDYKLQSNFVLEEVQVLENCNLPDYCQENALKVVSTKTNLDCGTLAFILDADRDRLFMKNSNRLGKKMLILINAF